ncbi:MAG: hypothetical protein ACYC6J_06385 [Coriobacteriia bacterium]
MYFSDAYEIARTDADDWFDPILDADTKLFVDPFLIFQETDPAWAGAHDRLMSHFNTCFQLIAEGNQDPRTVAYKKALALLRFPEPREFCLGYTEQGTSGAGGGLGYARLIAAAMEDAIARGLQDLRHFEELGVLNEGIGPDRISDLTCNILRGDFIKYTQDVATRHHLPVRNIGMGGASFDARRLAWRSEVVDLPINPANRRAVLLVPRRFLRALPVLNADDWWENYEAEQLRNDFNYEVLGHVRKSDIVAAARRHPESVRSWSAAKETTTAASYDFVNDPKGVWGWLEAARAFVQGQPLVIAPPEDDAAFVRVIELVINKFKLFVEEQGGWRLLWNDGNTNEKPEEAAQLLFKGIAQSYCEANNIVLDREVNLGRGPVDFKFSNGYRQRALLEIKKLHNGKFWHGLSQQLPSYLGSDDCRLGWFVAIRYRDGGATKDWEAKAPNIVAAVAREQGCRLYTVSVDGRPKASASRRESTR